MTTDTQPTDDEIDAVLCSNWPAFWRQATLVRMWLRDAVREAIAKWGQPAHSGEPVAWLHDCAALLTNDVELWIDTCPHCGKPRNAPQPVEREPLTPEQMDAALGSAKKVKPGYVGWVTDQRREWGRAVERAHGIKGGQHG